jgi:hypothetical protein
MKREPPPNLAFQISATHLCHVLRINTPRLSELTERGIIRRGIDEKGGPITSGYRFDTALNDYNDYLLAEARGKGRNAFEAARARVAAVKAEIASMKLAALALDNAADKDVSQNSANNPAGIQASFGFPSFEFFPQWRRDCACQAMCAVGGIVVFPARTSARSSARPSGKKLYSVIVMKS